MTKFFIEMKWRNDVMSIQLGMRKSLSDNIILVYFFRIARIHCGKKYTHIRFFLYTAHFSREICAPRIFSSLDILSPVIKICRYSQHILSPQSEYFLRDAIFTPQHNGIFIGGNDIYNFPWSYLLYNSFVWTMPWRRTEYLFDIYQYYAFYTKSTSPYSSGNWIYNFLSLYMLQT